MDNCSRYQGKNRAGIIVGLLLMLSLLFGTGAWMGKTERVSASDSSAGSVPERVKVTPVTTILKTDQLVAMIDVGLEGNYVRNGKYALVTAEITNNGDDFQGKFRIITRSGEKRVMYQKPFAVAKGETKQVQLTYMVNEYESSSIMAVICDEEDQIVGEKSVKQKILDDTEKLFVGALSDEPSGLGYFTDLSENLFFLRKEDITEDSKALDALDVIVINDYDTQKLSGKKIAALEQWVSDGGTLVLGTGAQADKTLKAFSGILLNGTIGETKKIKTSFGGTKEELKELQDMLIQERKAEKISSVQEFLLNNLRDETYNFYIDEIEDLENHVDILRSDGEIYGELKVKCKEDELTRKFQIELSAEELDDISRQLTVGDISRDITQLKLEDAKALITDHEEILLSRITHGDGCVLVSEFSFALENSAWNSHGLILTACVRSNTTGYEQAQLKKDDTVYSYTDAVSGLDVNEVDGLPNLKLYGVLLFIYAALVGPVFYVIFRRKDKRSLLWGAIPAAAIVFSVMIYLIGTSTRIQKPYINYLSQVDLNQKGQAGLDTAFAIVSANNKGYQMTLEGGLDIIPASEETYNDGIGKANSTEYKYGLEYGTDKTVLYMDNLSAFESAKMEISQKVKKTGDMQFSNISLIDGKWTGIVTNNMPYDLEDCLIYRSGDVISLGTIKKGESISLDQILPDAVYEIKNYSDDFDYLMDEFFDLYDYDEQNTQGERRKSLVCNYVNKEFSSTCWFYGFAAEDQVENEFSALWDGDPYGGNSDLTDLKRYGETAVTKEIPVVSSGSTERK